MSIAIRWLYPCKIERVIDGDTLIVEMDLGLHTYHRERVRLKGVHAPDLVDIKNFVLQWVVSANLSKPRTAHPLLIQTFKTDEYGKYVGVIWNHDQSVELNIVVNTEILRVKGGMGSGAISD